MEKYDHKAIEEKWQSHWAKNQVDKNNKDNHDKEKFYMLDMLPYPSGDGLHMGHTESYTASDIMYRYKRMQGYHVLHPQAFDSFGLPAENYAIKTGIHPSQTVTKAGDNFIRQMKSLGLGYDYDDVFYTSSPEYYRWTQWLFSRFFENDLVYRDTQTVNWCPGCNTTLANEQVEAGQCERCKSEVIQKEIPGWYFRITNFADDLIHKDGDAIDWPEHTKKNQNAWIGKSEGAKIQFAVKDHDEKIEIFTTRPDTLFGATYMVLAPEHALVSNLKSQISNIKDVEEYIQNTSKKSELERLENKEKTGVQLEGIRAINPANGEEIPVFIADYVLAGYGTGAIMAVPAHDERDRDFAEKFDLPIKQVVSPGCGTLEDTDKEMIERPGVYAIITNDQGEILIQHNANEKRFQLPGGGIDKGEDVRSALIREIKEETDYVDFEIGTNAFSLVWHVNTMPEKGHAYYGVKYIYTVNLLSNKTGADEFENDSNLTLEWVSRDKLANILEHEAIRGGCKLAIQQYLNPESRFTTEYGYLVNSAEFDGVSSEEAKVAITKHVGGELTSTYRLKDWSISRQRYWGAPIPIVYDPEGNAHLVPDEHLPWTLPTDVDFVPKGTAPLADSQELVERTEQIFGKGWRPETDTMDTFVCSSWYFLRYPDPNNTEEWCSEANRKYWQPVDLYIGGAEHTYMHLLYARFWVKAMQSIGLLDYSEPFLELRHQGYVLDEHGKKMSKSKGNVVNPDDVVGRFGADAVRLYMMFAGPLEDEIMWNENGVVGMYRFIERVWRQQDKLTEANQNELRKIVHKTIKKVSGDVEKLRFNTAISTMMECVNAMDKSDAVDIEDYQALVKLLSVFAPHVSQEILSKLGREDYVSDMAWPEYDESQTTDDQVSLAVQVNGKMRGNITLAPDADEQTAMDLAQQDEAINKWILEGEVAKVVYVPGRILNIVVQ